MLTLNRKGLKITCDSDLIPAQGSANVPVYVESDSTYSDYIVEPHIGWISNGIIKKTIALYENNSFAIPENAFEEFGKLYISLKFIKGDIKYMTNQIVFDIEKAPNATVILPAKETWNQAVLNYFNQWSKDNLDPVKTELEQLSNEAKKQQNKVTEQQTALDNKFNELNTLENIVNKNETTRQQQESKRQSDTANAIKNCNDKVSEINNKLDNGDFIGPTGATPNITIGNVTLGNPNITIRGTPETPILDFTMPNAGDLEYATDADIDEMIVEVFG